MFRYLVLILILLSSCDAQVNQKSKEPMMDAPQWESIFNGKNLDGWIPKIVGQPLGENYLNTFSVEEGILRIRYDAYGANFNDRFGGLYFHRKLKNYWLRVEYRFVGETAPGAPEWGYRDSGVQYHSQSPQSLKKDQAFPICLEYNFHGGNGTDDRPVGAICAIGTNIEINGKKNESFCTAPTIEKTFHGDQWVTIELDINNGKIRHFVSGEEILSFSNPSLNPENDIAKSLIQNDSTTLTEGYISFQSNSHPIDFRKIELLEY